MTAATTESAGDQAAMRYTVVAIILHWLIALLLLTNIWQGWRLDDLRGLAKFEVFQVHKSIGITVLMLTLVRIGWRLTHKPPPHKPPLKAWEGRLSSLVHFGFYFIMLALPLTGWAIVSVSKTNIPTLLFDTIPWPHLPMLHDLPVATKRGLEGPITESHHLLVKLTYGLIVLHVVGALKHLVVSRDGVVHRMIPLPFLRGKVS